MEVMYDGRMDGQLELWWCTFSLAYAVAASMEASSDKQQWTGSGGRMVTVGGGSGSEPYVRMRYCVWSMGTSPLG